MNSLIKNSPGITLNGLKSGWDYYFKGYHDVEDAQIALSLVEGIIVSNHGGRQLDGTVINISLGKDNQNMWLKAKLLDGELEVVQIW